MKLRNLLVLVACTALVAGCAAAGKNPADAHSRTPITVVLDWTPNTNHSGIYIAKAKRWYAKAGLDVKIVQPGQGENVLAALAAGKADFAISTEDEVTPAVVQGVPVESVAAIIQHDTSSFIALKSSGIKRPRDFQGKVYGGFGGQLETALVKTIVKCDGGNPSTVKLIDVGDSDYRTGLTKHSYDFVWIFDGWEGIELTQLDHLRTVSFPLTDYQKCIPDYYTPVIATADRLAETDPATVRAFMTATKRGYQDAAAHPSDAVSALLAAAPALDRTLVERSAAYLAPRYAANPARWGYQDPRVWERMTKFLTRSGMVTGKVDISKAYTNRFLGE